MNTQHFQLVIYWSSEDEAYVVEVPELPGCMADGKTRQEALVNAEVIIQEWAEVAREEGRDIPKPQEKLLILQKRLND